MPSPIRKQASKKSPLRGSKKSPLRGSKKSPKGSPKASPKGSPNGGKSSSRAVSAQDRKQSTLKTIEVLETTLLSKNLGKAPAIKVHPPLLRMYKARKIVHKLVKAVARRLAETHSRDTWKQAMRELITTVHYAQLDFDHFQLTVDGLLSLKTTQLRQRNKAQLTKQIKAVTNHYSPSQLARQAVHAENGTGKGSMTQGHDPA